MKHTTQLLSLRSCLRRRTGEYDLFPLIVADLSEENRATADLMDANNIPVTIFADSKNAFAEAMSRRAPNTTSTSAPELAPGSV
jgi:hypothetical protein